MKAFIFLLLANFLFFAACNSEPPASQGQKSLSSIPDDTLPDGPGDVPLPVTPVFLKKFTGKIGSNEAEMVLVSWGDGLLTGKYWIKKELKPVELNGELQEDNLFTISEYVGEKELRKFEGKLEGTQRLSGFLQNDKVEKRIPFRLTEISSTEDKGGWAGEWYFNEPWSGGFLLIGNVTKNSFDFALSVSSGGNSGIASGQAKINENKAVFLTQEFASESCALNFERVAKGITIDQKGSSFACGFGHGVYAKGTFEALKRQVKPTLKVGNDENSIFPNKALHDAFKKLTGDSLYETFAFNLHQFSRNQPNSNDNLAGTTVISGGVQGLYTQNEAIVMYDSKGKFWAATLDYSEEIGENLVRYVTNDERFKTQLPPTIEDWRANFSEYRVVFEGKKSQNL